MALAHIVVKLNMCSSNSSIEMIIAVEQLGTDDVRIKF